MIWVPLLGAGRVDRCWRTDELFGEIFFFDSTGKKKAEKVLFWGNYSCQLNYLNRNRILIGQHTRSENIVGTSLSHVSVKNSYLISSAAPFNFTLPAYEVVHVEFFILQASLLRMSAHIFILSL